MNLLKMLLAASFVLIKLIKPLWKIMKMFIFILVVIILFLIALALFRNGVLAL